MTVVQLRGPSNLLPERNPHDEFAHTRKAMLSAFLKWVRTDPAASDVAMEVDSTANVMRSTYWLETDDGA